MSIFDPTYIEYEQDTKLKSLVLNRLSKSAFDSLSAPSPDEIWFIQESNLSGQPIVVDTRPVEIPTKLSEFQNDVGYLSAVSWSQVTGKPTIPTNTSQLTNDSGFCTSSYVQQVASKSYWTEWYTTSGQVDYVDYINTNRADFTLGIPPTTTMTAVMEVRGQSVGNWFLGTGDQKWRFFNSGSGFYFDWNGRINTGGVWDTSKWYEISAGNYYFTIVQEGGSPITNTGSAKSSAPSGNLMVGSSTYTYGGEYVEYDVRSLKIYDNGVMVKDYRPARDQNGVACFFEEVSQDYEYPYNGTWTAVDL